MKQGKYTDIHPNAQIGDDVTVGSFSMIAEDVQIGDGTWIGNNVTIMDGVRIGRNCRIFPGAVLGAVPQDLKFEGEQSILEIKDNVVIREYCTLNRGTKANYKTLISNNCLLMAYVHVGHDCILEENVILANNVNLAGHIEIGKYAILGGLTAVHQFVKIGHHCFVGGGSLVRKDIPPFVKAAREPLAYVRSEFCRSATPRFFKQADQSHSGHLQAAFCKRAQCKPGNTHHRSYSSSKS